MLVCLSTTDLKQGTAYHCYQFIQLARAILSSGQGSFQIKVNYGRNQYRLHQQDTRQEESPATLRECVWEENVGDHGSRNP